MGTRIRAGLAALSSKRAGAPVAAPPAAQTTTQTPEIVVVALQAVKFPRLFALRGAGGIRRIFTFFGSFGHFIAVMKTGTSKNLSIVQK
jgi:hypothetical protein